jgi:carbamoyltransferase
MAVVAGISGYERNAAVAVARTGRLAAVCEQGRVVRIRDLGARIGGFPEAALRVALEAAGSSPHDAPSLQVVAEPGLRDVCPGVRTIDHHEAHARTAFSTSALEDALVLVCDSSGDPPLTVWRGHGGRVERERFEWHGPAFAELYARLTARLGLRPGSDEYRVEAMARLAGTGGDPGLGGLLRFEGDRLEVAPEVDERIASAAATRDIVRLASIARAVQQRIGELLIELLAEVRSGSRSSALCLGGGLFFNTYLNTVVRASGIFDRVFVPVNPGNAGICAGCALSEGAAPIATPVSPFLGPEYSNQDIKAVLDNCKLSYDFLEESEILQQVVASLRRGELVGWFQGRLEWGTRALGNRTIFANPQAPYVLENLNRFLKHREAHRAYGLAVTSEHARDYFEDVRSSPYMECEYRIRDPRRWSQICPPGIERVRVQTVDGDPPLVRRLLAAFAAETGAPVLVNTSFNGFHEPIVCAPRDAVRVFYGTGIDMLVAGNFVLRK